MNMTRLKISKTLLAVTLGSVLVSGSAFAETTTTDKAQSTANTAGDKISLKVKNELAAAIVASKNGVNEIKNSIEKVLVKNGVTLF